MAWLRKIGNKGLDILGWVLCRAVFFRTVFIMSLVRNDENFARFIKLFFQDKKVQDRFGVLIGSTMVGNTNLSVREAWLEQTLKSIPPGKKVLDAGAGELQYKRFCGHLDYTSQDFAQYDGKGNNHGLQTEAWDNSQLDVVSDITTIPVEDESFDAVMCIEVLEHIPDPAKAVKEFSRILKKGGTLILTAPFCSLTHFAPYHFSSGYNRYWYERILPEHGFSIQEITPNGNYFDYLAQEVRRLHFMNENYLDRNREEFELMAEWMLLKKLEEFSAHGGRSSELLNFGFHVKATKQ